MKKFWAFLFTIVFACSFVGFAEAGTFADIIAYIKTNTPMGAGKIPWPAFMILLATGIVGILGIRRKGKRF
ncbi:MAG: hypothetical protein P8185_10330 [Deltaproteobacteria bacterium]|jgi:hypothetical protein